MEKKFKAWIKADKLMINVNQLIWHQDGLYISGSLMTDKNKLRYFEGETPNEFMLLQYTGLKDKEGKEIFEGDIIKIKGTDNYINECFEVVFEHGAFCIKLDNNPNFITETNTVSFHRFYYEATLKKREVSFEIIGNKYDNPELLK